MRTALRILGVPVFVAIIFAIGYGAWQLERRWNYKWSYKAMVQETVREMVRQESLK